MTLVMFSKTGEGNKIRNNCIILKFKLAKLFIFIVNYCSRTNDCTLQALPLNCITTKLAYAQLYRFGSHETNFQGKEDISFLTSCHRWSAKIEQQGSIDCGSSYEFPP